MAQTRREFVKTAVAASVAAGIGIPVPTEALAKAEELQKDWKWDKSVCRFCGVGCGIMMATHEGRVTARRLCFSKCFRRRLRRSCVAFRFVHKWKTQFVAVQFYVWP